MANMNEDKDIDIDHIVFLVCEKTQITIVFFSPKQKPINFCLVASWAALISA
jgi:stress response protein SCP2